MLFKKIQEITPPVAFQLLQAEGSALILDVREKWEHEIVSLPQSFLYPLGKLLSTSIENLIEEIPSLPTASPIMTLCHHGIRSKQGAAWLLQNGLPAVSIQGGIEAWVHEVDQTLPRY